MEKGFFVTGTDTGVGKTTIASAIARALSDAGKKAGVMKPVETGCIIKDHEMLPHDALILREAARTEDLLEDICPYRFTPPLAPFIAAEMEGVTIDLNIIKESFDRIAGNNGIVLVEGAGGLLAPVTEDKSMADVALALDLPLVIVAPSRVGAINHTLLTYRCASAMGLEVKGVILNDVQGGADEIIRDLNVIEIERLTGVPVLGVVPHIEGAGEVAGPAEGLLEAVKENVDLSIFGL